MRKHILIFAHNIECWLNHLGEADLTRTNNLRLRAKIRKKSIPLYTQVTVETSHNLCSGAKIRKYMYTRVHLKLFSAQGSQSSGSLLNLLSPRFLFIKVIMIFRLSDDSLTC